MIIFCSWQQLNEIREYAEGFGFKHAQPLFFVKKSSSQVLKANMRVCGATETAIVLYRDKLPKFNNNGRMILDWFEWDRGGNYPKIHPTQKPIPLLKQLIQILSLIHIYNYNTEVKIINIIVDNIDLINYNVIVINKR